MSKEHHTSTDDPASSPNEAQPAVFDNQQSIIKAFFDNSPLLLGVAELDGNTILGVNGNAAVAQLLGISPEDIPHRTGEALGNTPEENQIWLEHYRHSQQEGQPVKFEYQRLNRNNPQWLSATVKYLGTGSQNRPRFSFMAEDITERKQLEQALEASERKYRELIQYAPIGFYKIDFRTGRLISINDSAAELTGYSREELLQMTAFDLLDQESQVLFKERIRQWLLGDMPQSTVEYRVTAKDGHTIYTVLNVTFTRDEHGQPLGATVIGYDITERKQAEQKLVRDLDAMTRLQKLGTLYIQAGNLEPVLTEIVDAAIAISGADFGTIQLLTRPAVRYGSWPSVVFRNGGWTFGIRSPGARAFAAQR